MLVLATAQIDPGLQPHATAFEIRFARGSGITAPVL
jgi:hypothetical protein